MPLTTGARLGPYEIVAPLGAGGMGEVYKARDSRLGRLVAIKIVSDLLAGSAELRQRFDREAKTISQLSHPNICALYDVGHDSGTDYLVLEFVEGETLAARIARGALEPAEALAVAIQIGSALDTAHRHGVVHRDLKPANVMLTKAGAKLLDFGLAKMGGTISAASGAALSVPPTVTTPITARGTILGTFQYLAPEQIEGAEADVRADIWSFGCVLYEMLTGKRAFEGKSHASLIGAILKDQPPPLSATQPLASPALEQVVRHCLAKDPEDRWQTARDLVLQLQWIQEGSTTGVPAAVPRRPRFREGLAWTLAGLAAITAGALAVFHYKTLGPPPLPVSFTMHPPDGTLFGPTIATVAPFPAFAPDGRSLVFIAQRGGQPPRLWIRTLDSVEARELHGTDSAEMPFWSPDSRAIGFFSDNKLKRIDATGGTPQIICEATQPEPAAWSSQGIILFVRDRAKGLASVPATGGQPTDVLELKSGGGGPSAPNFLPDGRRFLFYARGSVFIGSLDGGTPRRLMASDSRAEYASPGFILFVRGQTLFAQPLDADRGEIAADAFPVADGIRVGRNGRAAFTASQTGILAYRRGLGLSGAEAQLTWYSAEGKELGTVGQPAAMSDLALSPDGRRLAIQRRENDGTDIWVVDTERATLSRLTIDPASETHPLWSTDGRSIFFSSLRGGGGIYRKAASGVGSTEQLVLTASEARPHSLSRDGRTVVFDAGGDVWIGTVGQLDSAKPLLANGAYTETLARLSPDEHYLAYVSTESGREEIYVATFPDLAERWMVTTGGGTQPIWSHDGKRLYYVATGALASGPTQLMIVDLNRSGGQLRLSPPKALVTLNMAVGADNYAVAPDGRILVARTLREQSNADPLTIVLNWTSQDRAQ